ncbi:Por secretion system C-terminal sorting domain-containing protein [Salegentibacter echinorum]|uniref:Por secretion system C-terminal sorting domain-containing protein n=1 Tax=Salegentibacter echinorum TaxID=1073325 RepID=A0A1M5L7Q1_SALEC|nr:LamG-like jellyroll fold domain-containing protein [Salegentibacter echinorum]SHG60990.1 Por secretion system C-terminal sorting domain-containing protein [Salegentibacter echinorum]
MGKITPRIIFFLLFSWFLTTTGFTLPNNNYGPQLNFPKQEYKKQSYFIGFSLNEAPSISAPADINSVNEPGNCYALKSKINLGSATVEGTANSATNDAPSQFSVGATTVTWSVTDDSGNTATDTQIVTIADNEDPNISAPAAKTFYTDSGKCSASGINLGTPSSTDNCGINNISNNAPGVFPVGNTTVQWTATDNSGNTKTVSQTITVSDNEKPVITHNGNKNSTTDAGECGASISVNATANDNCSVGNPSGKRSDGKPLTALYPVGTTTITWAVTDANGNTANFVSQTITVTDDEKPTITHNGDQSVNNDAGECGASLSVSATANDNCSVGNPSGTRSDGKPLTALYPVGTTIVTWTATDANGNTANQVSQTITVTDDEKPTITHNGDQSVNNEAGECGARLSVSATADDNCSVGNPSGTRSDGKPLTALYPVGTTTITWTVTDNANNTNTATQTINVIDNQKPVPPILEDITWGCEYTVEAPVAVDNCDGEIIGTPNRTTRFTESGTIIWTFTDTAGNSSTVEQTITINQIELEVKTTDILCNGFATGEAEAIVTGGVGPFTYDWGALGNGTNKDGLSPGTYQVSATDVNGCKASTNFSIKEPETFIEINNIIINEGCYNQDDAQLTVDASGGTGSLTYLLNASDITSNGKGVANNLASGNYSLEVVDENNCSTTDTININNPEQLIITDIVTTETNTFGSATGTATVIIEGGTPNFTFQWSNGQTAQTAKNLKAGDYSVTVTDANGCQDTQTVTVIDPLKAVMLPTSRCLNDDGGLRTSTFEVDTVQGGIPPYTYKWDFGGETNGGTTVADDNTATGEGVHVVNYVSSGTYEVSLTVTDDVGNQFTEIYNHYVGECFEACGKTNNIDFVLDSFFIGKEDGTALQGSECASYSGKKYIYLKIEKNSNAYNPSVEFIYTISQSGEFISEERITGCIDIGNNKIPSLFRIGEVQTWDCGNAINLESFYMDWTNNPKKKCGDVRNRMCVSTNENSEIYFPLSAIAETTNIFCNGSDNGIIKLIPSGGVGAYQFTLTHTSTGANYGPQTSGLFENLPAGIYTATVSDDKETYTLNNIEITQPENPLTLVETSQTKLVCFGGSNATATVEASGGTAPYTIVWDHISQTSTETTGTATKLSAGIYSVNVVDDNGCEETIEITVAEPEQLIADAGADQTLECGVNQVQLFAVFDDYFNPRTGEQEFGEWKVVNGPSGAVFADPENPNTIFTIITTGKYTLEWILPCGSTDRVEITFSNCSTIDFDGINDYIDFGANFNLSGDFTLEAWIKQDPNASTGVQTILSKRDNANLGSGGYDLIIENNIPKFRWNTSEISSAYPIGSNRWYHIAVVNGGSNAGLYVDGLAVSPENQSPGTPTAIESRFLIGAMNDSTSAPLPTNFFHGWIEEVRIWDTSLNLDQIKFMMNQRIKDNGNVRGEVIPLDVPNNLTWANLKGYYRLITSKATNGITKNIINNAIDGRLKNIQSTQQNTAPLPYIAINDGEWSTIANWEQPQVWDIPNSPGINGENINWNIVKLNKKNLTNAPTSDNSNSITLLGLLDDGGSLKMKGENNSSGNELRITHYLELNGNLDLNGESQLIQPEGSILTGSGYLTRDQQGTASSYNYNYWSSPVVSNTGNQTYSIASVMHDGTDKGVPKKLDIGPAGNVTYADGTATNPRKISGRWLYSFLGNSNDYSDWSYIGKDGKLAAGEGYTMKGTSGKAEIKDLQNYTFKGFPNNGNIKVDEIKPGQNYLLGNPYPSSISVNEFILDNIKDSGGRNTKNLLNGAVYFWDHFGGQTHTLREYVGGYAVRNLIDGVPAISTDSRIDANGKKSNKRPGAYIPVAQGFFVNTTPDPQMGEVNSFDTGEIIFKNSQRRFKTERAGEGLSFFMQTRSAVNLAEKASEEKKDERAKIRLEFISPTGYHREISVGVDVNTTAGFDLGYDAPLIDEGPEDMYWVIGESKYIIQGVPHFNLDQVLPVGLTIAEEKEFTIALGELENLPDDVEIFVKDNIDTTYYNLRKDAFRASLSTGKHSDRYSIVFQDKTEIEEEEEIDPESPEIDDATLNFHYQIDNRKLIINNPELLDIENVIIYSLTGQQVLHYDAIPPVKTTALKIERPLSSAVYIVKIITADSELSKKVIIRND